MARKQDSLTIAMFAGLKVVITSTYQFSLMYIYIYIYHDKKLRTIPLHYSYNKMEQNVS